MAFNTELVTRQIVAKIGEIEALGANNVLLENPSTKAKFPCCVVQPPLQRPEYHGGAWDLSITVEVWSDSQYKSIGLFDLVKMKLADLNFTLANNTPLMQDPVTKKWRFGGYLEVRWNAISNAYERNR